MKWVSYLMFTQVYFLQSEEEAFIGCLRAGGEWGASCHCGGGISLEQGTDV